MESDWNEVTILRKKQPNAVAARSHQAVNQAMRKGAEVETTKKFAAGSNRQHMTNKDTARLDRETEELSHSRVSLSTAQALQRARQACGLTQKELATKIAEKPQVVNEYESGKAIPNNAIMGKLERALGVKLRGKDIGAPLARKGKK